MWNFEEEEATRTLHLLASTVVDREKELKKHCSRPELDRSDEETDSPCLILMFFTTRVELTLYGRWKLLT